MQDHYQAFRKLNHYSSKLPSDLLMNRKFSDFQNMFILLVKIQVTFRSEIGYTYPHKILRKVFSSRLKLTHILLMFIPDTLREITKKRRFCFANSLPGHSDQVSKVVFSPTIQVILEGRGCYTNGVCYLSHFFLCIW